MRCSAPSVDSGLYLHSATETQTHIHREDRRGGREGEKKKERTKGWRWEKWKQEGPSHPTGDPGIEKSHPSMFQPKAQLLELGHLVLYRTEGLKFPSIYRLCAGGGEKKKNQAKLL